MDRDEEKQTEKNVNEQQDEMLTVENIDERVECYLSQLPSSETATPLIRTINNLQTIYTEKRRLEQAWARINDRLSAYEAGSDTEADTDHNAPIEALFTMQPVEEKEKASAVITASTPAASPIPLRAGKFASRRFHVNWRVVATGLVAAILLFAILGWPLVTYALHGVLPFIPISTPQSQPTPHVSGMKEYSSQYFKIQYPANWVVTQDSTGDGYRQTLQIRPSVTSETFISVNVLPDSETSAEQLLQKDLATKPGNRLSMDAVTYHGLSWHVGVVENAGVGKIPAGKLKVAYSNQGTPYRIEFGALADKFDTYTPIFNAMFSSFYAQTAPVASSTATATSTATPTAVSVTTPTPGTDTTPSASVTPSPIAGGTVSVKIYSGQYFKLQYPANWVITQDSFGGGYQQTMQLRPAAASSVSITINVLSNSSLSATELLQLDPDLNLGSLLSTSSATYHGISWNIGIANIIGSVLQQSQKVEVAYTSQSLPYKVKLSAPPDMFDANAQAFNTVLTSFNPTK